MSTKLDVPRRTDPLVDKDSSPTKRVHAFFESIPQIAATQTELTLTFTLNAPTAGTAQTIADGSSPTSAEIGQFMQNVNTVLSSLITELTTAGVIKE